MPFNGPLDAIKRVLTKVGVDPAERISPFDQDPEYTACRADELPAYFELYRAGTHDPAERAVLCCFLLEGLNDFCATDIAHPLQAAILEALLDSGEIHSAELAYWSDTSDPDPENWWPVTKAILKHRRARVRPEDRDFISERIARFQEEAPAELLWQLPYVVEFEALPLFPGWTETLGIRPDGALLRWSTESEYVGAQPITAQVDVNLALVSAARRFPNLQHLIPMRPDCAVTCVTCGGCGHPAIPGHDLICSCGGTGWIVPESPP